MCGSTDLEYSALETNGTLAFFPYTCYDCNFKGKEFYNMTFKDHTDSDGNRIKEDKTPKIAIIIKGGLVQEVLTENEIRVIILDYDTDGIEFDELVKVRQMHENTYTLAYKSNPLIEIMPERVKELFNIPEPKINNQ